MKLRDLVAHSLPGRKKKKTPELTENLTAGDQTHAFVKASNVCHSGFRNKSHETCVISETSWRGNALYRGLDAANGTECEQRRTHYSKTRGVVTSRSADGFTCHGMTPRNQDDLMTLSDIECYCSVRTDSVLAPSDESYPLPNCNCNFHHHHHQHSKTHSVEQQEINLCHVSSLPRLGREVDKKQELGFFRKSLASIRGKKKQCRKSSMEVAPGPATLSIPSGCSACPGSILFDKTATPTDKKPVKPKRKGLKGLSKSKENSNISKAKGDNFWYYDSDPQLMTSLEPPHSNISPSERFRQRECSVESCSSRISQGNYFPRDYESTGFDSASLSGYESDLPRDKVHRSRSRIKTNPWLPSPRPSLSSGRRVEICELRESEEEGTCINEKFPRSASLELSSRDRLSCCVREWRDREHRFNMIQRHRSLTPIDMNINVGLNETNRESRCLPLLGLVRKERRRQSTADLNDLNCKPASKTCIVSPNTEFVMLTDNLEQLAHNISFEYEDLLDSTLECASSLGDTESSVHELLIDEESVNMLKETDRSCVIPRNIGPSAHSPDSGVGGLACSDGDETTTVESHKSTKCSNNSLTGVNSTVPATLITNTRISSPYNDSKTFLCLCEDGSSVPIKRTSCRSDISSPTMAVNEMQDVHFQPAFRYVHGDGNLMRSLLSHEFPPSCVNNHKSSYLHRVSDTNGVELRMPSLPSIGVPRTLLGSELNDMAKRSSLSSKQGADWRNEFPRNIPSLESPTDNLKSGCDMNCEDHSCVYVGNDTVVINHAGNQGEAVHLKTDRNEKTKESKETIPLCPVKPSAGVTRLTNYHADKAEIHAQDVTFDVSVQTDDWDDECIQTDDWDDSVLRNVQENTRLWLLTGNMLSSADTGYCSLSRDSHIYPDDEGLFTDEPTALEKDSFFETHGSQHSPVPSGRQSCSSFMETSKTLGSHSDELKSLSVSNMLTQAVPENTLNETFSKKENQFREICHHFQNNQDKSSPYSNEASQEKSFSHFNENTQKRSFSHLNGEQSFNSSVTTGVHVGKDSKFSTSVGSMMDVETGENKELYHSHHCEDELVHLDYMDINVDIAPAKHKAQIKNRCGRNETNTAQIKSNSALNEYKHINNSCARNETQKVQSISSRKLKKESEKISEKQLDCHDFNESSQEKADYLEFLKDAPLKRPHLKRPLFLVPGLGPVDMSTNEHRKMFSQLNQALPNCHHSHSHIVTHVGKKQKFKKCLQLTPDRNLLSAKSNPCCGLSLNDSDVNLPYLNNPSSCVPFHFNTKTDYSEAKMRYPLVPLSQSSSTTKKLSTRTYLSTANKLSSALTASNLSTDTLVKEHYNDPTNTTVLVRSLCEDKQLILQTIQQARRDETERQQQRSQLERSLHGKKRESLLESLQELRAKLEIQTRKLNSKI